MVIVPVGADKLIYYIAPPLTVMSVVGLWAVIPLAPNLVGTDINVGVIYLISIGAIGTLAIMLAGWSSNNKYAVLGAFRSVAMLISYEVPMVLALLIPTMLAGSMGTVAIVEGQRVLPVPRQLEEGTLAAGCWPGHRARCAEVAGSD